MSGNTDQAKIVDQQVREMDAGKPRNEVMSYLLSLGYERKDAARLTDSIDRAYQRIIDKREFPMKLLLRGISAVLVGAGMFIATQLIIESGVISVVIYLVYISGAILVVSGLSAIVVAMIRWGDRNYRKDDLLDF
jgi:hypothetical protein